MKRFLIWLMVIAGTFGVGWQLARPGGGRELVVAREELAQARAEIVRLEAELKARPAPVKIDSPVVLQRDLPAASGEPPTPMDAAAQLAVPSEPQQAGAAAAMRQMLASPGMREMIQQQQKAQISLNFGRLIERFGLNPEERSHFEQLLADRLTKQTDAGLKMMGQDLTEEQQAAVVTELQEVQKASDEAIQQFLNHDGDYAEFKHWEDTQPERTQYEMFGRSLFAGTDHPLSGDQETQLIDLMAEVRKLPVPAGQAVPSSPIEGPGLDDVGVESILRDQAQRNQVVLERSVGFLSPQQIETLAKLQEQQLSMTEAGLRMSSSMMLPTLLKAP